MNRAGAAALVLALVACGRERPDPRLAEVTAPLHVTVRVIDAPVARACVGTTLEQVSCLMSRAERQGCVYVEVGEAADVPVRSKAPEPLRCMILELPGERAVLVNQPGRKATLFVEPGGERVVVDLGDSLHALYLRQGRLRLTRQVWEGPATRPGTLFHPDGALNWSHIPPFLSVMSSLDLIGLSDGDLEALLAQTPGGKATLKQALVAMTDEANTLGVSWSLVLSKLEPADRAEVRDALVREVSSGNDGALKWFLQRPEEQKPDFVEALDHALASSSIDASVGLLALLPLAPSRAEQLACELIERSWHENTGTESYGFVPPEPVALAVIASRRSKCPWVLPLLERNPCDWELQCDPDVDDEKETPLCTPAQRAAAVERTLHPKPGSLDEDEDEPPSWGPVLLAAVEVQGPLPAAIAAAHDRRLYALSYRFKGPEEDDPCRTAPEEPADWACRLPLAVTTSSWESCRLVVDDAKKTLTVTPLEQY
ncbi:MAG: hypothetical protein Q8L48_08615 [Archangium sp.]|nr:hypothetical protein [Archangium sp.]